MTRVALLDWFKLKLPISTPASDGVFVFVDLLSFSLSDHIMDCQTDLILLVSITGAVCVRLLPSSGDVCVPLLPPSGAVCVRLLPSSFSPSVCLWNAVHMLLLLVYICMCAPSSALTKTTGNWEREATHYSPLQETLTGHCQESQMEKNKKRE